METLLQIVTTVKNFLSDYILLALSGLVKKAACTGKKDT